MEKAILIKNGLLFLGIKLIKRPQFNDTMSYSIPSP
jgi:hypothetical protein